MGIETAIIGAIISSVAGLATGMMQANEMKSMANAQKRAQKIASNKENNQRISEIKKRVRERRIKMAKMQAMSDAQGAEGSSGELGAMSASSANVSNAVADSSGTQVANQAISKQNQRAADHQTAANSIGAIGKAIGGFASLFG